MRIITPEDFGITDSEKTTAIYLLRDLTVKQITELRHLSFDGVQSQTKRIREKMQSTTMHGALARMIAVNIINKRELITCLPKEWNNPYRLI